MVEYARDPAGAVGPGEDLVAHRAHRELADRRDEAERLVERADLEREALRRSQVGE